MSRVNDNFFDLENRVTDYFTGAMFIIGHLFKGKGFYFGSNDVPFLRSQAKLIESNYGEVHIGNGNSWKIQVCNAPKIKAHLIEVGAIENKLTRQFPENPSPDMIRGMVDAAGSPTISKDKRPGIYIGGYQTREFIVTFFDFLKTHAKLEKDKIGEKSTAIILGYQDSCRLGTYLYSDFEKIQPLGIYYPIIKNHLDIACLCVDNKESTPERIELAKQLLTLGLEVRDVADQTGYSSAGSFSHIFKDNVGVTPTKFRIVARVNQAEKLLAQGYKPFQAAYLLGYSSRESLANSFNVAKRKCPF